jgi:hypothetical protein
MIDKLMSADIIRSFIQKLIQRPDYYAIKHFEKQRRRPNYVRL